ncbi:hypothetical protein NVP1115B_30 [Vibrio phage 1.115.B._10N.222.49.B11]|nr:hypothetical protein NVP1085O_26 [Vibrio phage 1.085.O._10N.222.51.E3]AUR88505.1 hypothetical protein NVP1115A_30 [Vibrio phage 1.115.A._10N.222.49.B11]AUR88576.1 hypothetical protein NVP1115B_30 [Vibrio phage 1.115.B._10N.222.49.B11]AUR90552.1 hypothetical protein NVP1147O_29 [Vibrio phage 1.147.O._10N.286.49.E9]AUR91699.1 hypothetical protein NVP1162O_29 [Vibrio phage 1.162.O._10N.261.48.E3]AUR91926.1 hypothetical protein NVP1167O_30 [Vibrio phage 1.167.O._10N.261.51.F2]AUR95373.1 hypoth
MNMNWQEVDFELKRKSEVISALMDEVELLKLDNKGLINYLEWVANSLSYTHPEAHSIADDIYCLLAKHKESEK